MEVRRIWNEVAFDTAQRCLQAGAVRDDVTRKALERAAARYFWAACGMERGASRGFEPAPLRASGKTPR